jgi:hypothetical protein
MVSRRRASTTLVITDAAPSSDDALRARRRRYATLMTVHIAGFALSGVLYYQAWWLGLTLMIVTGVLPWIAVVAANDAAPRASEAAQLTRNDSAARELESRAHIIIESP